MFYSIKDIWKNIIKSRHLLSCWICFPVWVITGGISTIAFAKEQIHPGGGFALALILLLFIGINVGVTIFFHLEYIFDDLRLHNKFLENTAVKILYTLLFILGTVSCVCQIGFWWWVIVTFPFV